MQVRNIDTLNALGSEFVSEHIPAENVSHFVIAKTRAGVNFDGSLRQDVLTLQDNHDVQTHAGIIETPIFVSSLVDDTSIEISPNNTAINAKDCSPAFLLRLCGELVDNTDQPLDIQRDMVTNICGALLCGATLANFSSATANTTINFAAINRDTHDPYMATSELYYSLLSRGEVATLDVHDIVQHQLQLKHYGTYVRQFALYGHELFNESEPTESVLQKRKIVNFIWGAVF